MAEKLDSFGLPIHPPLSTEELLSAMGKGPKRPKSTHLQYGKNKGQDIHHVVSVTLTATQILQIREIGKNNLSKGIRTILEFYRSHTGCDLA